MSINNVFSISTADFNPDRDAFALVLGKAKAGDQAALSEIYTLYFKKIYRFIFFRVGHKQVAEDLAEEVFLKAFTKLGSLDNDQSFTGWLYQISRNLVIDYYRQKKTTVALDE